MHVGAVLAAALSAAACARTEGTSPAAELRAPAQRLTLPFPQAATLRLEWVPRVPRADLGPQPTIFVHLLDAKGEIARTFDHEIAGAAWQPARPLVDEVVVAHSLLAAPLAPGRYALTAGLYEPGGERYRLASDLPRSGKEEYQVAQVEVPAAGPLAWSAGFDGEWLPIEAGGDLQTPARRWLAQAGDLRLGPLAGPHRVGFVVHLPLELADSELVLEPGGTSPRALLDSDCAPQPIEISEAGIHRAVLALEPPAGGVCTVALRCNFRWLDPVTGGSRALSIEELTVTPVRDAPPQVASP